MVTKYVDNIAKTELPFSSYWFTNAVKIGQLISSTVCNGCPGSAIWWFRKQISSIAITYTIEIMLLFFYLYIAKRKKGSKWSLFCISVLIVYIFIKRMDVGHCFLTIYRFLFHHNIMLLFFSFYMKLFKNYMFRDTKLTSFCCFCSLIKALL